MKSRKMVVMNLLVQGRSRDADIENGYVDAVEKGVWNELGD